jgi:hypothetical protein
MPIEYKIFSAEVKKFDDENLILEHFISTEHKDRGGDIMRAKGMKVVGKPVVLLLHGRGPMGSEPVGKPLSIDVDEFKGQPGILVRTQFYKDEVGQRLYGKAKGGFLPNWSIGYMVDEAKDLLREGKYDGRDVTKWTLLEYSPVGVPMNPFAQTIKEFLDKKESGEGFGEDTSNPRWFGFVDAKDCKECGQGCTKHKPGECVACKALLTVFTKADGTEAGRACEKCQPEEFARLKAQIEEKPYANEHACRIMDPDQFPKKRRENNKFGEGVHAIWGIKDDKAHLQAIRFDSSKFTAEAAKKWAKNHDYTCILFEPATGKEEEIPEAEPELLAKIAEQEGGGTPTEEDRIKEILAKWDEVQGFILATPQVLKAYEDGIKELKAKLEKLEPLLKTLPPEPDGGEEGNGKPPDNPPGKKTPPRLVIVREEDSPEAKTRAAILGVAKEVIGEAVRGEIDRMKGRVP